MNPAAPLPDRVENEDELDELMTRPTEALVRDVAELDEPLVILGAGGKMGPSLAAMVKRAADEAGVDLDVYAVSRFRDPDVRDWLESRGVATIAADLLEPATLRAVPDAPNVVYLAGLKFGTSANPALTWAVNTLAPAAAVARWPEARFVALSTGNVYPFVDVRSGGATESTPLAPPGEYAHAAIARERILDFAASRAPRADIVVLRLNYALDLRYGVVRDIADDIHAGRPVDLATGHFNAIWQRDANAHIVRALALADNPPAVYNLTGPETLETRAVAETLARLMNREPEFVGAPAETALLSNPSRLFERLGPPETPIETVVAWTADWVARGGRSLGRPTKFQVRDGKF